MSVARTPPGLPLTLHPSRLKWTLMLLGSLAAVVIAVFMLRHAKTTAIWDVCTIVLFGLGVLIAFVNLMPGASYLQLGREGFEMSSLYRKHRVAWSDVAGFGVMSLPTAGRKMVGWNYLPGRGKPSRLRQFNLERFGYEAALPDTYGMEIVDLVALLESARAQGQRTV